MRVLKLAPFLILSAGAASADTAGDALTEIVRCAGIADSSARLNCFDAAASNAKRALGEFTSKDKRTGADTFGLPQPRVAVTKPEDFGRPPPPPAAAEVTQVSSIVVEFGKSTRGKALFVLDNGQVWRQLDGDDTNVPEPQPGAPMKVTIAGGMFGSYNLTIEGRNALIKVRRVK